MVAIPVQEKTRDATATHARTHTSNSGQSIESAVRAAHATVTIIINGCCMYASLVHVFIRGAAAEENDIERIKYFAAPACSRNGGALLRRPPGALVRLIMVCSVWLLQQIDLAYGGIATRIGLHIVSARRRSLWPATKQNIVGPTTIATRHYYG